MKTFKIWIYSHRTPRQIWVSTIYWFLFVEKLLRRISQRQRKPIAQIRDDIHRELRHSFEQKVSELFPEPELDPEPEPPAATKVKKPRIQKSKLDHKVVNKILEKYMLDIVNEYCQKKDQETLKNNLQDFARLFRRHRQVKLDQKILYDIISACHLDTLSRIAKYIRAEKKSQGIK